jgi:hypothetical protein
MSRRGLSPEAGKSARRAIGSIAPCSRYLPTPPFEPNSTGSMNDSKDCARTPHAWPNRAEGFVILAIFAVSRLAIWLAGYCGARAFGDGAIEPLYLCRHDCLW